MSFNNMETVIMTIKTLGIGFSFFVLAIVVAVAPGPALGEHPAEHAQAGKLKPHSGELVRIVRESTRRFQDVNQATAEGYQLLFGCVSGPDDGAMGMHYVNLQLVADGVLDPSCPEIVIYEPLPNGGKKLIGADFLVFSET